MTSILGRIFGNTPSPPPLPGAGEQVYQQAMTESRALREKMRECSSSTDAVRAVMADIWAQNNNVPFLVTVFEAVQEVKSGTDQKPS
jgi:hypothetical protein